MARSTRGRVTRPTGWLALDVGSPLPSLSGYQTSIGPVAARIAIVRTKENEDIDWLDTAIRHLPPPSPHSYLGREANRPHLRQSRLSTRSWVNSCSDLFRPNTPDRQRRSSQLTSAAATYRFITFSGTAVTSARAQEGGLHIASTTVSFCPKGRVVKAEPRVILQRADRQHEHENTRNGLTILAWTNVGRGKICAVAGDFPRGWYASRF